MILSDSRILKEIKKKNIIIEPFNLKCLGSNSYDVHLSQYILVYTDKFLDCKKENRVKEYIISKHGFVLYPNSFYLGSTIEYTESLKYVPFLEGKSSIARLGMQIHSSAGKGDVGYKNAWTFEISVKKPIRIYHGMPIAQLIYFKVLGAVKTPYNLKKNAKYNVYSKKPSQSKMHLNFD